MGCREGGVENPGMVCLLLLHPFEHDGGRKWAN